MTVITISRQYGSWGDEIASRLCEILGYRFFDKRMMAEVASEAGLSPEEIIDSQEDRHKVVSFLDRLFGVKVSEAWITRQPDGTRTVEVGELDGKRYATVVHDLIEAAYKHVNVVILGRGGQVVLKGQTGVLNVRVEAPFEERVRRVNEQQKFDDLEAARNFVTGRDQAGEDYLRQFYNVDWADPTLYHLVINTGQYGVDEAVQQILGAIKSLPKG
ncbi:MAG TPA: cytidylate kinase-like family protein [Anaerolineaceae bacterium]